MKATRPIFALILLALLGTGVLRAETWIVVPMHPAGASLSVISATDAGQQAGYVDGRAAVWGGTAASYRDIHPLAGATNSYLLGIDGGRQAGYAVVGARNHAAIWSGTTGSFVDLHPAGASDSGLRAAGGGQQAGFVIVGAYHAGIWSSTAASFVDLHALLPGNYSESEATDVWSDGDDVFVVGKARNEITARDEAFLWRKNRPATIRISGKKTRVAAQSSLRLRGAASDADGNLARVEVKVGKAKWKKARNLAKWTFIARGLAEGRTQVRARAVDAAGVRSVPAKLTLLRR